jgi:hypothetical protein
MYIAIKKIQEWRLPNQSGEMDNHLPMIIMVMITHHINGFQEELAGILGYYLSCSLELAN